MAVDLKSTVARFSHDSTPEKAGVRCIKLGSAKGLGCLMNSERDCEKNSKLIENVHHTTAGATAARPRLVRTAMKSPQLCTLEPRNVRALTVRIGFWAFLRIALV